MMMTWLGEKHNEAQTLEAGALLDDAIAKAFATGTLKPTEFGGPHGTEDITRAVLSEI